MNPETPILLGLAAAATLAAAGCSTSVARLDGPDHRQRLNAPVPIAVTLKAKADPTTFTASIDGRDVTDAFVFEDGRGVLTGHVYEAAPPRQPHTLTVAAEPGVNAKGRPLGRPFTAEMTYFPPALSLQGNVGMGPNSRVELPRDGRTSVMVRLPQPTRGPLALTVTPTDASGVVLNDHAPGQAITIDLDPGRRVAVFTVRGHRPGVGTLRVEAPGYVAAEVQTFIDGPTLTAAVATP
ncbi:MAG: hypothetical protein AAF710_04565 [Planctomycetota bacterium]